MVAISSAELYFSDMPIEDLKWCNVSLSEVINAGKRLEAVVFNIEGKQAREVVANCKWGSAPLYGDKGISTAYTCGRFKRIWLEFSDLPIYQPSSITCIKPTPDGFLSRNTKTNIDALRVKKGQILITCSGTTGKVSLVSNTLDGEIFSHDLIRLDAKDKNDIGYIYIFLRSKTGNTLLQTNNYGAVIKHIEPEHLAEIPIPMPPQEIKAQINELVLRSFELRDKSNEILDSATALLVKELNLPPIEEFATEKVDGNADVNNYSIKLSELSGRFDGSFHVPIVNAIKEHLKKHSKEITTVSDKRLSKDVILPGRFKRTYVAEKMGVKFIGGKEISQLLPDTGKYLSRKAHCKQLNKGLEIKENSLLTPARGTLGSVVMSPQHFYGWAISDNLIQIVGLHETYGYLFVFLNTEYGSALIKRFTYGGVVDALEPSHLNNVEVPLLKNGEVQSEINRLALEANDLRYQAYLCEQEAMKILNEEVLYVVL